jgi:hypothetical protein
MSTTLDKFRGAALSLARSGAIKDRLTDAYRNHLSLVDESELPIELVDEFRAVNYALNRERPVLRGEDAFRATVRKMSNKEADEVASSVVRLFGEVSRAPAVAAATPLAGAALAGARKGPKQAPQVVSLYPGEAWTLVDKAG